MELGWVLIVKSTAISRLICQLSMLSPQTSTSWTESKTKCINLFGTIKWQNQKNKYKSGI